MYRTRKIAACWLVTGLVTVSCGRIGYGEFESADGSTIDHQVQEAPPPCGLAGLFNGMPYAVLARPVQDDFTIETWIKTTQLVAIGSNAWDGVPIIYGDLSAPASDDFTTGVVNGSYELTIGSPDTTVRSTTNVATGGWTHIAATRQRSTSMIQVLVNGVIEQSAPTTNTNSLTASSYLLLAGNLVSQIYLTGQMDEFRIWNVVRSPSEIASTMHQRFTGNEPGLVVYFPFEEGSGNTLIDGSPTRTNATVMGSLAWTPSDAPICP